MDSSPSHLVLLPSYNTGPRLAGVIAEVLRQWRPVLVVVDGSTDGSERILRELAQREPGLSVLALARNSGKGAAVLAGLAVARDRGFTHALVMDADGQHPAATISEFMAESLRHPAAMILGRPVFGRDVPFARLYGRKLSVGLTHLETLGPEIGDPLYGFRVYPVGPLLAALGPAAHRPALRFRHRGGGPALLDGRRADQPALAGPLFHPGRRRRFALSLPARQPHAHRHAHPADPRTAVAALAGRAPAPLAARAGR